ncbi:MAG TPA: glycosyl hydrolase [Actinomycetes bacterium]|nr:glycosyl hydrolase [Actinomycetes bacterium]
MTPAVICVVLAAGVSAVPADASHSRVATAVLTVPDPGCLYHGVYPGGITGEEDDITLDDVTSYEAAAGRSVAWVFFSNNWYRSRSFPLGKATWIRDHGSIPYVRLMLRHSSNERDRNDGADKTFSLRRIVDGDFDRDLRSWANNARDFGSPILAEYGTEMNGFWFSWNATHNGDRRGAPLFRRAYRHIIDVVRARGADNVSWVFHVNDSDQPSKPWNRLERYYPGDQYIDWLATSVYGALTPQENWNQSFARGMNRVYPRLRALAPSKPIIVAEFGVTKGNDRVDPITWARRALDDLLGSRWPRVRGFSWWNETWENDNTPAHDSNLRIQSIPGMSDMFISRLENNPNVLDAPVSDGSATCG